MTFRQQIETAPYYDAAFLMENFTKYEIELLIKLMQVEILNGNKPKELDAELMNKVDINNLMDKLGTDDYSTWSQEKLKKHRDELQELIKESNLVKIVKEDIKEIEKYIND